MTSATFQEKQQKLVALFSSCLDEESKYLMIIELGKKATPLDATQKTAENKVKGCQSTVYLHSYLKNGRVYFEAESDAYIAGGLAALLIQIYSGETPETILKCPPTFIEEIGLTTSLTSNRANGLYSIHLRMKQDALKFLVQR